MSCPRNRSRSGFSVTRVSSSPISWACRPSSSSASISASRAVVCSSSIRATSTRAKASSSRSARGGPRQRLSAARRSSERRSASPPSDACATSRSKRCQIDLLGLDVQDVARLPSAHEIAAESLPQVRDQVLNRPDRRPGRLPRPQLLDQAVRRDDLACTEQEHGQEGALLRPPQLERSSLRPDLERAQDTELDLLHLCRFTTGSRRLLPVV